MEGLTALIMDTQTDRLAGYIKNEDNRQFVVLALGHAGKEALIETIGHAAREAKLELVVVEREIESIELDLKMIRERNILPLQNHIERVHKAFIPGIKVHDEEPMSPMKFYHSKHRRGKKALVRYPPADRNEAVDLPDSGKKMWPTKVGHLYH